MYSIYYIEKKHKTIFNYRITIKIQTIRSAIVFLCCIINLFYARQGELLLIIKKYGIQKNIIISNITS